MSEVVIVRGDRLDEIEDFLVALNEWGVDAPDRRRDAVREFLKSPLGLTQYLEREVPERVGNA